MPNLKLLTELQQKSFDACPKLSISQKERYFAVNDKILSYINTTRSPTNQVGFLIQLAYFKASAKFFYNKTFPLSDIKYACEVLELDDNDIDISLTQYSPKSRSMHKNYILNHLGWQKFTPARYKELQEELSTHAKQQAHPQSLLPLATKYLVNNKIELPPYYVFAEVISTVYNEVEDKLIAIVDKALSKNQKIILDDLIWIGDRRCKSYKYSALSRIKQFSYSTKIKDIEESIKNYKLLKAFYKKFEATYKKLELSENATQYYSEWVNKSRLFQLKQFKSRSKAYLYLLAHLKHQYFRQTDLYVDILLKLVGSATNTMNKKLEKHHEMLFKEQKKMLEKLMDSYECSREAFLKILDILDNTAIDLDSKNKEIRAIVLNELGDKKLFEAIDYNLSNETLKNKLLKSIGSSLQRKLTPIISELDFETSGKDVEILNKIHRHVLATTKEDKALLCKGTLFSSIFNSIKSGKLNIRYSYNYLPINEYFIDEARWEKQADTILETTGLNTFTFTEVINILKERINEKYTEVNEDYRQGKNKHLSWNKSGKFIISTPKSKKEPNKNKLNAVFSQEGIVPIAKVLEKINNATNFVKHFKHHSLKKVIMKPTPETIFAGILSKGCNHGTIKMANISKGINKKSLNNTVNWFFNLENVQAANNAVVDYINTLSLPNIYKIDENNSHTSSDGQKFNVGVDSILANYSFKYFGQSQGISVYTFIDDRQVMFYDTVLSPGAREAAFVIDGLMANNVVKSHIHSTDTHGYTEVIFAVMYFLGVSFAPRIKNLGEQQLYCINSKKEYNKQEYIVKPSKKANTKLIENNWDDMLRFVATIKTKTITASQIFKRLNSYTKELPLYRALKELGRIIKTIYILTYINDITLRKQVEKQLNRIELFNKFAKAVFFANSQEFRVGSPIEQKIIVACKSFIQNCIVLWNYLVLSQVLIDQDTKSRDTLLQVIKAGSVISWRHINLHGEYDFTAANEASFAIEFDLERIRRLRVS